MAARPGKRKAVSPVNSPQAAKRERKSIGGVVKDLERVKNTNGSSGGRSSTASNASVTRVVRAPVSRISKPELAPFPASPSTRPVLDTFVFGTGSMAELGLGPESKNKTVKRPRLNPHLATLDVVDVSVGGMHSVALLRDGRLVTWGVNDHGALGRDTTWDGGVVDADAAEDSDSDNEGLNPKESTPAAVETDVKFVKAAASDSLSVAIDVDGGLWAWGTFRCSDGILGFSATDRVANRPTRIQLKDKFADLARGSDHVLALTTTGKVYAWGNGQQFQLGRRVVERTRLNGLVPREFGLKNVVGIGAGSFHSFARTADGKVYAWGLSQFGQCGVPIHELGEDGAVVAVPTEITGLTGKEVVQVTGGEHHSIAITKNGDVYVWGRMDAFELGLGKEAIEGAKVVKDAQGKPRFVAEPTLLKVREGEDHDGEQVKARVVSCGSHHNILVDTNGHAWSWGFGESYQVGQGPQDDDIEQPTRIINTATNGKQMVACGAGGQFSVLCALREEKQEENKV
ncbi:hypothetical protein PYCC9005_000477 [Savitreella phatthalungensis]